MGKFPCVSRVTVYTVRFNLLTRIPWAILGWKKTSLKLNWFLSAGTKNVSIQSFFEYRNLFYMKQDTTCYLFDWSKSEISFRVFPFRLWLAGVAIGMKYQMGAVSRCQSVIDKTRYVIYLRVDLLVFKCQ